MGMKLQVGAASVQLCGYTTFEHAAVEMHRHYHVPASGSASEKDSQLRSTLIQLSSPTKPTWHRNFAYSNLDEGKLLFKESLMRLMKLF